MTQQFFWPTGNFAGRSVGGSLAQSGIVIPNFRKPATPIPVFIGSGFGSGLTLPGSFSAESGFCDCVTDTGNETWLLTYDGALANPNFATNIGASEPFIGIASIGTKPYAVTAISGLVYTLSFGAPEIVPPGFGGQVWNVASDGAATLYAAMPVKGLGTFDPGSGVASAISAPIVSPYLVATASGVASGSSSAVAIAGISPAVFASGLGYLAADPASPTTVAVATVPGSNALIILTGADPIWSITGSLTGYQGPGPVIWTPAGNQVLACRPAGNAVDVVTVTGSTLVIAQTLSVTDASQVAVTIDGSEALVVQPSANFIGVLTNSAGTWSVGSGVSVQAPASVVITAESAAVAAGSAGLTYLTRSGNTWGAQSTQALAFSPTKVVTDANGALYVIGAASGTGYFNLIASGSVVGSMTWAGSADDVLVTDGQVAILDAASSLIRFAGVVVGGSGGETYVGETATQAVPASTVSLAMTGDITVWACGATTELGQFTRPFFIDWYHEGQVAVYASGQWAITSLGVQVKPTALTWRADGTVWVAAANEVLSFNAVTAGELPAVGTISVPVYPGQTEGVPLGMSSLIWSGDSLFATTCLSGVLIQVE